MSARLADAERRCAPRLHRLLVVVEALLRLFQLLPELLRAAAFLLQLHEELRLKGLEPLVLLVVLQGQPFTPCSPEACCGPMMEVINAHRTFLLKEFLRGPEVPTRCQMSPSPVPAEVE